MNKTKILRIVLIIFSFILVSITIVEILRSVTNWPKVILKLDPNQGSIAKTMSIWDYLPDILVPLAYFTTWTNIQVFGSLFLTIVFKKEFSMSHKIGIMLNASLTFFVFAIFLAPLLPWGQNAWFDFIYIHEHLLMFIIALVWFYFSIGKERTKLKKTVWSGLSMPLIYLVVSTGIYIFTGVAVYPFINYLNIFNLHLHYIASYYLTILFIIFLGTCIAFSGIILHRLNNYIHDKAMHGILNKEV